MAPEQQTPDQTVVRHEERLTAEPRAVARERVTVSVRTTTSTAPETVTVRREMLTVESVDGRPVPGLAEALAALGGADSRVVAAEGAVPAPERVTVSKPAGRVEGDAAGATFVLHEERAVASTRVRPYERVRVERVVTTDQVPVTEPVRTEHVEIDDAGLPTQAREGSAR